MVTAPANDTSVAIAAALVIGCRRLGTHTRARDRLAWCAQRRR